jgi:hypothetical protein
MDRSPPSAGTSRARFTASSGPASGSYARPVPRAGLSCYFHDINELPPSTTMKRRAAAGCAEQVRRFYTVSRVWVPSGSGRFFAQVLSEPAKDARLTRRFGVRPARAPPKWLKSGRGEGGTALAHECGWKTGLGFEWLHLQAEYRQANAIRGSEKPTHVKHGGGPGGNAPWARHPVHRPVPHPPSSVFNLAQGGDHASEAPAGLARHDPAVSPLGGDRHDRSFGLGGRSAWMKDGTGSGSVTSSPRGR